ncbi:MAG: OmpA family protein [Bacteroidota bacterium]
MKAKKIILTTLLITIYLLTNAQDYKDATDHQLIDRYEGSTIISYAKSNYESYPLFKDLYVQKKPIQIEGEFTSINYQAPEGRSPLEVHRNYEQALERKGFKRIIQLRNEDTWGFPEYIKVSNLPDEHRRGTTGTASTSHYTAYQKGGIGVAIYTSSYYGERTHTLLDIIENKAMDEDMVNVNEDMIKEKIKAEGKIALYGILFDTGKATIQPESATTLQQVINYLNNNKDVQLYVVGHTDMTGSYTMNLELSDKRADAVVKYLVKNGSISERRLTPKGVGPVAPVATNNTDKGKSKNRRVELVLK